LSGDNDPRVDVYDVRVRAKTTGDINQHDN